MDPVNIGIGFGWGGVTIWAWSVLLHRSYRSWKYRGDPRSRREVRFIGILWVCALVFSVALLVAVLIPESDQPSAALFGLFCGMFTVAGATLAMSDAEPTHNGGKA